MILEKRQRSPLRPDFDRKNIPSVQRLIVRFLSSTYIAMNSERKLKRILNENATSVIFGI
ncbi:hypothetical protein Back11_40250 [Paenibacillus baekrokdamisoli]|uniref:Uncharacterized protein n=1 Tax=Paenibacillus baekrokdamisoli TaxID=1712516 RepID=A0A3G9IV58_9BACL|nr:hypothetical protein [Paenibacillus baekrokdamisoli]BBH22680.1 hypothetical protein Back11_40250 [Paenibacillus baekrokdamisoli]